MNENVGAWIIEIDRLIILTCQWCCLVLNIEYSEPLLLVVCYIFLFIIIVLNFIKCTKILNFVGVPEVTRCSTKRIGSLLNPFRSPCYIICSFCFKSIDDCNLSIRRPHCQGQINIKEESLCCIHLIIECYQLNFTFTNMVIPYSH